MKRHLFILALLLGFTSSIAAATDIPSYKITYEVVIKKLVAGELVIDVDQTNDEDVTITGETFPNMLAKTFGDGKIIEIIKYQKIGSDLKLQSIKEIKGEDRSEVSESNIDWDTNTIKIKDRVIPFNPKAQMDAYTLPFLRVLDVDKANKDTTTKVVSAKKAIDYIYADPVDEILELSGDTYETVRYTKYRNNDKSRMISIWVSKQAPAMPLKIEVSRKGKPHSWVSMIDSSQSQ